MRFCKAMTPAAGLAALAAIMLVLAAKPQEARAQSPFKIDVHGFVNPHYYADSRQVVGGREEMMLFFPKPELLDSATGTDLNKGWNAQMLAITARLGLRVSGPEMLGARTSAYVEGDFTGPTNATINTLRLRHAYLTLDWGSHRLLAGQYWHPMVVHEVMPMTNPLNMGAPFHPYARYNQVRYEWHFLDGFEAVGVAAWQLDNMSTGLLDGARTSSTRFQREAMVPELHASLRYRSKRLFAGAAVNALTIQPVVPQVSAGLHTSVSYSLFGSYRFGFMTVKAQTLLNNSLYEICSLGGYLMAAPGEVVDWHFNTVWVDVERARGHWRPGLFAGYARNNDYASSSSNTAAAFGRGADMEYLWRVQPRLTYTTMKGLSFTAEAEYTRAGYATPVGNLRLSLSAVYDF